MRRVDPARWRQLSAQLDELLELDAGERGARLAALRAVDPDLAGELAALGVPPSDEAIAGYIRAEQVCLVLGYSAGIMLANACNAMVLAVALWDSPDRNLALGWAAKVAGGAIYIAASLGWMWWVEKQAPDAWDAGGLVLCLIGSAAILYGRKLIQF